MIFVPFVLLCIILSNVVSGSSTGDGGAGGGVCQIYDIIFINSGDLIMQSEYPPLEIGSLILEDSSVGFLSIHRNSEVPIGPGSDLLRGHSPISLVRDNVSHSGRLILGDVEAQHFNLSCDLSTIMHIPYEYLDEVNDYGFSNVTYELLMIPPSSHSSSGVDQHQLHQQFNHTIETSMRPTVLGGGGGVSRVVSNGHIADIPERLANEILQAIANTGALIRPGDPIIIDECDFSTVIARLPHVKLTFPGNAGYLVFHPDDYFVFIEEWGGYCTVRMDRAHAHHPALVFNPLRIPHVNVHITPEYIRICDSIFEEHL